jgi:hypothetical protein
VTDSPAGPDAVTPDTSSADEPRYLMAEGMRWSVRLYLGRYDRRSRPDLVFECHAAVRRVRNYPDNWRDLSDEALFALSHQR